MTEISEEKKIECKEVFDLLDKEKNGSIFKEQLGDLMRALGTNPTEFEIEEMIREVHLNSSGKIEFNEFLELFSKKLKDPDTEEDLLEAFKVFDKNNDGHILSEELKYLIMNLGEKFTEEEADQMIRAADVHSEGKVNYNEFIKMIFNKG